MGLSATHSFGDTVLVQYTLSPYVTLTRGSRYLRISRTLPSTSEGRQVPSSAGRQEVPPTSRYHVLEVDISFTNPTLLLQ